MIPGSLDDGEAIDFARLFGQFRTWVRRYFWLWIAYQTVKGLATTTLIWVPLLYLYLRG